MTSKTVKDIRQVEAARTVMDRYTAALEALAGKDDAAEERLRVSSKRRVSG
ncbi:hypothetical protein KEU06_06035 [Pseudaminobacter sp. 19-2017]|uniref:Uncharacterized protein n=1 Tax=Pseudaminobacter soli (ex Zhang et al. 2022) TaxID=2831468 RepID=A0A942I7A3_9HYPH|nr:hypothetical protein [Pseudaminobacter soli]MBS3648185.1 hypothetical protein [Pseudaminobacter soli]